MNGLQFWCDAASLESVIRRVPSGVVFRENGDPPHFMFERGDSAVYVILSSGTEAEEGLRDHEDGDDAVEIAVRSITDRPTALYLYTSNYSFCREMMISMLDDPSIVVDTNDDGVWRGDQFVKALRENPLWEWWHIPRPRAPHPPSAR